MTEALIVTTTCETPEQARAIARLLVEQHLAACVQILPGIHSVYRWQGAIEESPELLLLIKTSQTRWPLLEAAIRAAHPYEVPEIVAVPVAQGSASYLAWLDASLTE
jgi:periplasmic divalent cation tolerance protein